MRLVVINEFSFETLILLFYYSDRVLWRSVWFCQLRQDFFNPFFCFNFESRLLLKKGPQFNLNLGQKKVGKNFWIFFYEKTFFSQQTCHSKKMAAHIFVASLHFPSRKNVASREYYFLDERAEATTFPSAYSTLSAKLTFGKCCTLSLRCWTTHYTVVQNRQKVSFFYFCLFF